MIVAFAAASTWRRPEPIARWLDRLPGDATLLYDQRRPAVLFNLATSLDGYGATPIISVADVARADIVVIFHGRLTSSAYCKAIVVEAVTRRIPVVLCEHDTASEDQVDRLIGYDPVMPRSLDEFVGGL